MSLWVNEDRDFEFDGRLSRDVPHTPNVYNIWTRPYFRNFSIWKMTKSILITKKGAATFDGRPRDIYEMTFVFITFPRHSLKW